MCDMGLGPESRGMVRPDLVSRGQDATELLVFALTTRDHWQTKVCGRCLGNGSRPRCRRHLIEDASRGMVSGFSEHRDLLFPGLHVEPLHVPDDLLPFLLALSQTIAGIKVLSSVIETARDVFHGPVLS
jgi:hypothetical protein